MSSMPTTTLSTSLQPSSSLSAVTGRTTLSPTTLLTTAKPSNSIPPPLPSSAPLHTTSNTIPAVPTASPELPQAASTNRTHVAILGGVGGALLAIIILLILAIACLLRRRREAGEGGISEKVRKRPWKRRALSLENRPGSVSNISLNFNSDVPVTESRAFRSVPPRLTLDMSLPTQPSAAYNIPRTSMALNSGSLVSPDDYAHSYLPIGGGLSRSGTERSTEPLRPQHYSVDLRRAASDPVRLQRASEAAEHAFWQEWVREDASPESVTQDSIPSRASSLREHRSGSIALDVRAPAQISTDPNRAPLDRTRTLPPAIAPSRGTTLSHIQEMNTPQSSIEDMRGAGTSQITEVGGTEIFELPGSVPEIRSRPVYTRPYRPDRRPVRWVEDIR